MTGTTITPYLFFGGRCEGPWSFTARPSAGGRDGHAV